MGNCRLPYLGLEIYCSLSPRLAPYHHQTLYLWHQLHYTDQCYIYSTDRIIHQTKGDINIPSKSPYFNNNDIF